MVVIIQPGFRQPLGLSAVKRAQRHAGFHAHRFHALHHLLQIRHIALVRVLPRRAHAKTGRAVRLGLARRFQHLLDLHQPLRLQTGLVARALRAVFAVFRASAGLDRQQRADLHLTRVKVLAVYGLRFEQQFKQRFIKQGLGLPYCPVNAIGHHGVSKTKKCRQFKYCGYTVNQS